jgi:arylsulfatase A-like enzyme
MASGKNVVLVVFDSLRRDCVGAYGAPPWGKVETPNLDALASESLMFTRAYPETLPTLPARRAMYTGQNVYPFHNGDFRLKGDFVGAPGWGPVPEEQDTLAELLRDRNGYRTGLIADVYHMFKPSKNFCRGFDQWMFLRGQEGDPQRSGPAITEEEVERWIPQELFNDRRANFLKQCLKNMRGREHEEDYFNARIFIEAARWLEENRDADRFFLCLESFDPHEPWFVPEHYRRMYDDSDGREQVMSSYDETTSWEPGLVRRTQANYSGLVTMCDRWFQHLHEAMRSLGLLDNTLLIVTSDHGHSIGDEGYLGKRGYPSEPAVLDIPLIVRHPEGLGSGETSDILVQHTDIPATILEFAGVEPSQPLDGMPLMDAALGAKAPNRDHVTVGWGSSVTVINDRWWLNIKIDGTGAFLYDLTAPNSRENNVADQNIEVIRDLFKKAVADARGGFPEYLMEMVTTQMDAPGCSELAARPV